MLTKVRTRVELNLTLCMKMFSFRKLMTIGSQNQTFVSLQLAQ